jgi:flagellar biosynthesis protein FlhF
MRLRTFEGFDLPDALGRVKEALGSDAVILSTREVRPHKGVFGLFGRARVEVTAAADPGDGHRGPRLGTSRPEGRPPADFEAEKAARRSAPGSSALFQIGADIQVLREEMTALRHSAPAEVGLLRSEVAALRNLLGARILADPSAAREIPARLGAIAQQLAGRGMDESLAAVLALEEADGSASMNAVARRIRTGGAIGDSTKRPPPEGGPDVHLFVGPTGAGKTTTIAKLAAIHSMGGAPGGSSLAEKKRVGLVTLDTYRIAAVEQLKIYARIIGVPVQVASEPEELAAAMERFSGLDLVLIDTAGRNPFRADPAAGLAGIDWKGGRPVVHLVLPATSGAETLLATADRFADIPADCLLFTKIDECVLPGEFLTAAIASRLPVSYVTTGQKVPEDIEVADAEKLAGLLFGESVNRPQTQSLVNGQSSMVDE